MTTTAIMSSNIGDMSSYGNRMVTITITGMNQKSAHLANQKLSVAYSRLSQTMQNIHRCGGKVVSVSTGAEYPVAVAATATAPQQNHAPAKKESGQGSHKKKK